VTEQITYFVPGPTFVRSDVMAEMTGPMIGHRSGHFVELYEAIQPLLQPVLRTRQPALITSASGTMAMELAVASLVPNRILHLVCGGFSERWLEISQSRGVKADALAVEWGEGADLEALHGALASRDYDAVTITHNETSTGVINPLQEIATIIRAESDALVLADCVSSLAGAPMEFDAWGIDFALAGVQKALSVPAGLAVFAASERAYERAEHTPARGFYTDLLRYRELHDQGFTITTPAISVMRALLHQLGAIDAEGIETRWDRHAALRAQTAEWAIDRGFTYASSDGVHSPTVSCLRPPTGITPAALLEAAARRGFTVGAGYGKWKNDTIRIGHMGEVMPDDLDRLFGVLDDALTELPA
jgi:aspartate aminotransferase-like enzyme